MAPSLTPAEAAAYRSRGYHSPVRVFSDADAAALLSRFDATERAVGGKLVGKLNAGPHLLFPWICDVVRHPAVLDAVESVLGPDIMCYSSQFFTKRAGDPAFVSFHQDKTYWGLSTADVVTAWVAFTPSTPQSGCMRIVPGTHLEQLEHVETYAKDNMLTRGQEVAFDAREEDIVDLVLQPGEMSLHHVLAVHGSGPNRAPWPRVGLAIRYLSPRVKQVLSDADSAMLVRGTDATGNWLHDAPPEADMHPDAVRRQEAVFERRSAILFKGAKGSGNAGNTWARSSM
ncbi:hypothetical protein DFJ74DRAFT_438270 [Hyaloraphidium curvatum]|nr:hypothetical protein DFJ74DRAFT_438270 [Hyaloraphidium curvatum]